MQAFKDYFEAGKPVVGIRTACHSFQNWLDFDGYEFGSHYHNHYPANKSPLTVATAPGGAGNPILQGVADSWQTPSSLYKMLPLTPACVTLLNGAWQDKPLEPIAWTTTHKGGRVFFTALGAIEDFKNTQTPPAAAQWNPLDAGSANRRLPLCKAVVQASRPVSLACQENQRQSNRVFSLSLRGRGPG